MKILALDAALGGFSVALDPGDGAVRVDASTVPDALERGLARLDALLRNAELRLAELDRLAVGLGPGSFTGVRIALAYAKALAQAADLPLVGISSYDAREPDQVPLPVLTVVRGRRGVASARLRDPYGARTASGPVDEVLDLLLARGSEPRALVGDTEDVLPALAERGLTVPVLPPRGAVAAAAILDLARTAAPAPSPHALAPDYGEAPAVTQARRP